MRTLVLAALSLGLMARSVHAEDIYCATVIAIIGGELGGSAATMQLTTEIKQQWLQATGRLDEPTDIAWLLIHCVDTPSATVAEAIQQAISQEESVSSTRTAQK